MAKRLQKNTGVIALHISEDELEVIDRIAQSHGLSRSGIVLKAIKKHSLETIFSGRQEQQLKAHLNALKVAAQISDLATSSVSCQALMQIHSQTNCRLSNYRPAKSTLKFFPRRREGLAKTTSVRITPETVESLRDICWMSGLTMTDIILRLLTRRQIPDRQIAKTKLLIQRAITTLRGINSQNPAIQQLVTACTQAFQQTYERLAHDF